MDLSLRRLEQAVSVRRQIDALERRFAGLVGGGRATTGAGRKTGGGRRRRTMSAAATMPDRGSRPRSSFP